MNKKEIFKKVLLLLFFIVIIGVIIFINNLDKKIINENNSENDKNVIISIGKKVSKSFFANTKTTNNAYKYKGGFVGSEREIVLNKIEIIDNRTSLNGLAIFSENRLDNIKIKILPCSEMPLATTSQVLGDCFEINPGTEYKFAKSDYSVFPAEIFKNIGEYNFKYDQKKGGVFLNHFNNQPCKDCGDGNFYTGTPVRSYGKGEGYFDIFNVDDGKTNKRVYFSEYSYFNGYYYINFEDKKVQAKKIEDKFGKEIKNGYYVKNDKVFAKYNDKKILLKGVEVKGFDVLYLDNDIYYKDNNYIYSSEWEYGEPCGHHACTLKEIKIKKLLSIKNKEFSVYNKDKKIIKINNEFYLLNQGSTYKIDIKNERFKMLLEQDYIFSEDKIIYLQHNKILKDVDAKTFKKIGGEYFADKKNIYIYGKKHKFEYEFDYDSLQAFESGLIKDKNAIYLNDRVDNFSPYVKNNEVDVKTFKKIACKKRGCYFKDKNKIYYHWGNRNYFENFSPDYNSFEYIENMISKDNNNLYQGNQIKKDVDIESFEKLGKYSNFIYFKDKNNYYKSISTWIDLVDKKDVPFKKLNKK